MIVVLSGYNPSLPMVFTAKEGLSDGNYIEVNDVDSEGNTVVAYPNGTYEWILADESAKTGKFQWRVSDDGGVNYSAWSTVVGERGKELAFNTPETAYPTYNSGKAVNHPISSAPFPRVIPVGTQAALQDAIDNALPFDVIRIEEPGNYVLAKTLSVQAPDVTLEANASAQFGDVQLIGTGMETPASGPNWGNTPFGIYARQPRFTLRNLTLRDFYFHGATFEQGAYRPTFEEVQILDCGQQFIKISAFPYAIDDGVVRGCSFGYTQGRPTTLRYDLDGVTPVGYFYGGFLDIHNSKNWLVEDNILYELTPTAEEVDAALASGDGTVYLWSPGILFWNRSSNTVIQRNKSINCARFVNLGLSQVGGSENDHVGGVVRNNFAVITSGRLGAIQQSDADGMINAWDSPGAKVLNNTLITHGQVPDAVQGRWSTNLEIGLNLADSSIRMRDGASYFGAANQLNAADAWFVDVDAADLHLTALGQTEVLTGPRSISAPNDIDGQLRAATTRLGADA